MTTNKSTENNEDNRGTNIADTVFNNMKISKWGGIISGVLGVLLLVFSIYILRIGIEKYKISIDGNNLTYIFGGLALSGLVLIITPMYFGTKNMEINRKIEIEEEEKQKEFSNNEERVLALIKENDGKLNRKEIKEKFETEFSRKLDGTVIYNLLNEGKKNNFIGSIRRKNNLGPLLIEVDKKIKLSSEGEKYLGKN